MLYCFHKNQTRTSREKIDIYGIIINSEDTVKLLGVTLDYRLDFDPQVCKKAATQLDILQRLKSFFGFKKNNFLF